MRRTEITTLKHAAVAGAICWFLRWVLDEDERRALREFWTAYVAHNASLLRGNGYGATARRFHDAEREMQRRGF